MTGIKFSLGFLIVMFGGAVLLAVVMSPYVDGVADQMAGADLGMFFLGLGCVFMGGNIIGAVLQEQEEARKHVGETRRLYDVLS